MCGIVGYVGGRPALDVVLAGLRRSAYEGSEGYGASGSYGAYDSAGVAVLADGGLATARRAGTLGDLREELAVRPLPAAQTGIGHLRRATHGAPADANAHPHLDGAGRVAVVQNGSLVNAAALRAELAARGHELTSETDTEAVAHLLAEAFSSCGDLAEAMRQVCGRLEGAFTLAAVHADEPEAVVGACRGAPLVVGAGDGGGDGEYVLASDAAALAAPAGEASWPGRERVVELRRGAGVTVTDFAGRPAEVRTYRLDQDGYAAGPRPPRPSVRPSTPPG